MNEECGNGILDPDEECDDGDTDPLDGCADCDAATCGDSVINWSAPFEGFETGDLTQLPWTTGGGSGGFAATDMGTGAHEGSRALLSLNHAASSTGWAQIDVETAAGQIGYRYRGESESGYDYLRFYIDTVQQIAVAASGSVGTWTQFCAPVTAGVHAFKWAYSKDSIISYGLDHASPDTGGVRRGRRHSR